MTQEELKDGTTLLVGHSRQDDLGSGVLRVPETSGRDSPTVLTIPPLAVTLSAAILSLGAVAALLMFIYMSYKDPNSASVLIPILVQLIEKGWVIAKKRRERNAATVDVSE